MVRTHLTHLNTESQLLILICRVLCSECSVAEERLQALSPKEMRIEELEQFLEELQNLRRARPLVIGVERVAVGSRGRSKLHKEGLSRKVLQT